MVNEFDNNKFQAWLCDEFPSVYESNHFAYDMTQNIIEYGQRNCENQNDLTDFLVNIIPEITREDVERFVDEKTQHYECDLVVDAVNATIYKEVLNTIPEVDSDCLMGENDTYSETVVFPNGYSVDVKICGVKFEEGENNVPWTEAVLFDENNCEVDSVICESPTAVGEQTFFDKWELEDDKGNTYTVNVVEAPERELTNNKPLKKSAVEIDK